MTPFRGGTHTAKSQSTPRDREKQRQGDGKERQRWEKRRLEFCKERLNIVKARFRHEERGCEEEKINIKREIEYIFFISLEYFWSFWLDVIVAGDPWASDRDILKVQSTKITKKQKQFSPACGI